MKKYIIPEIMKNLNNMIKKKIGSCFVHDEILEQKKVIYITKYIRKMYHYLINIQPMILDLVHTVKMTTSWIGTYS